MDINDYLLNVSEQDWTTLLAGWAGAFDQSFNVWMVNRFSDVFAVLDDESVHMLDLGACAVTRVADSQEHFAELIDEEGRADDWLMIPFVDDCVAAGIQLGRDQCYGYKVPIILGGRYEVGNVTPTDLTVNYSFLADVFRQTNDLPDGTRIKIVVK